MFTCASGRRAGGRCPVWGMFYVGDIQVGEIWVERWEMFLVGDVSEVLVSLRLYISSEARISNFK